MTKKCFRTLPLRAINNAMEKADIRAKEEIKKSTEGLMPNIPGMDLGNLF